MGDNIYNTYNYVDAKENIPDDADPKLFDESEAVWVLHYFPDKFLQTILSQIKLELMSPSYIPLFSQSSHSVSKVGD